MCGQLLGSRSHACRCSVNDQCRIGTPLPEGAALHQPHRCFDDLRDDQPSAAYSLEREQIDGAFSFDTDDYILEARWWHEPIGRDHLDVFKAKIARKGKNALGLYISVSGFTKDALEEYSDSTPFITMDGMDIITVLDERVRLDELLKRKKRHANETGECYFPATAMM